MTAANDEDPDNTQTPTNPQRQTAGMSRRRYPLRSRARLLWMRWRPRAAYWTAAAAIGLAAAAFAWSSEEAQHLFFAVDERLPWLALQIGRAHV